LSTFVIFYFIKTEVPQKQHKPKKQESRKHGPAALKSQEKSPAATLLVIGILVYWECQRRYLTNIAFLTKKMALQSNAYRNSSLLTI